MVQDTANILTIYHSLGLSLQTENSSLSQILSSIVTLIPSGQILNLHWTKRSLVFVCFSFFYIFLFLDTCTRLSWSHSAFQSTLNSPSLYRIRISLHVLYINDIITIINYYYYYALVLTFELFADAFLVTEPELNTTNKPLNSHWSH